MLSIRNRAIAAVTAAAIALTTAAVTPAAAAPAPTAQPQAASYDGATDFSARRRGYSRGNAAAASVMLGIIGAVGAYAAAREYRKAQERRYYDDGYYGRPQGYYGRPYGYGGPYRYGY